MSRDEGELRSPAWTLRMGQAFTLLGALVLTVCVLTGLHADHQLRTPEQLGGPAAKDMQALMFFAWIAGAVALGALIIGIAAIRAASRSLRGAGDAG